MIKVSDEFKEALKDENRNFSASCTITLTDDQVIPVYDGDILDDGFKFDDATSNDGAFDIGSAIVKKFTLSLNNYYGDFSDLDFTGAEVSDVGVSLILPSGKTETIEKGIFTVSDTTYDNDEITLECLDNMHKFDKAYKNSTLTYPATLLQIVQDACKCCDVVLATDSLQFENYDYVIQKRPDDESITFRDVLTWVGQISVHFWRCNAKGQLSAGWYDVSASEANENIHTYNLSNVTDITADMDDVVITCVKVVTEDDNMNQITAQSGSDGYACVIDGNKLITSDNAAEVVDMMGERIVGLRFRPLSASVLQDPTVEAGDTAIVYDTETLSYKTFITNVVFSLDDDTQLSNGAESALRNSSERFSEAAKIYQNLKSHIKKNKTEWEKAYEELKKGMDSKSGLYPVLQTLDDGSTVLNFCNTPTLEDATVVVRLNAEGWGMSSDGGKTWNIGALVDGTTITKILNAIGINADWINVGDMLADRIKGGTLTLGGINNASGLLKILDENGVEVGFINNTGVNFQKGNIRGSKIVTGDVGETRRIEIDQSKESFFIDITPAAGETTQPYAGCVTPVKEKGGIDSYYNVLDGEVPGIGIEAAYFFTLKLDQTDVFHVDRSQTRINNTAVIKSLSVTNNLSVGRYLTVDKNLTVKGTKNRVIDTLNYQKQYMHSYETPTPMFGDVGTSKLNASGEDVIPISDIFLETVNTGIEYQVFLQKEGPGDIWVEEKTQLYFCVKGTPNLEYSWEIKAVQRDYEHIRFDDMSIMNQDVELENLEMQIENLQNQDLKELEKADQQMIAEIERWIKNENSVNDINN